MSTRSSDACVIVIGVSGSGKTTVARKLAARRGSVFIEADDLHDARAIEKMSSGHPLNDDDRYPWLRRIGERMRAEHEQGHHTVTACSGLKRVYRDVLREYAADAFFVLLDGPIDVVRQRTEARSHFMPTSLLESQFDTLEQLEADEHGITVDLSLGVDDIVREIEATLARNE